jgi:hypothetical protein
VNQFVEIELPTIIPLAALICSHKEHGLRVEIQTSQAGALDKSAHFSRELRAL